LLPIVMVGILVVVATSMMVAARDRATPAAAPPAPEPTGLAMIVFDGEAGPLAAVIGTTGSGAPGALVLPLETELTVPGQGEATVVEALQLDRRQAATAVANLLGVWIEFDAQVGDVQLAALVDRAGGIEVGGNLRSGAAVDEMLSNQGTDRAAALQIVLSGVLASGVEWTTDDLFEANDPPAVVETLNAAAGGTVSRLRNEEVASGVFQSSPETITATLVKTFGGPAEYAVPVIVLNGNGIPGIGQGVAQKILPGGFRVAVSENASTFDHDETLIVVGSSNDVDLAERVRDLLGVGSISVSVGSGIAPVTVVVGKDFIG